MKPKSEAKMLISIQQRKNLNKVDDLKIEFEIRCFEKNKSMKTQPNAIVIKEITRPLKTNARRGDVAPNPKHQYTIFKKRFIQKFLFNQDITSCIFFINI